MLIVHRMFVVFGLSIGKLKAVLKRKYSSFNTLSEFLVLKLAKVKVENSDDVLVLKEILVILESSQPNSTKLLNLIAKVNCCSI